MLRMMLEDDSTVVIPKGTTVIIDNPNDEVTKDETEGMARIHAKGSRAPFWTTNYMIKQARYFAESGPARLTIVASKAEGKAGRLTY